MIYVQKIPFHELQFEVTRSRGPGGQNVNRTNTAVILRWRPHESVAFLESEKERLLNKLRLTVDNEVVIRCEIHRSQDQNKSECLKKLESILANALKTKKKRLPTKPTHSSKVRKTENKKRRSEVKKNRSKIKID